MSPIGREVRIVLPPICMVIVYRSLRIDQGDERVSRAREVIRALRGHVAEVRVGLLERFFPLVSLFQELLHLAEARVDVGAEALLAEEISPDRALVLCGAPD